MTEHSTEPTVEQPRRRGLFSIWSLLVLFVIAAVAVVALLGWANVYEAYLEAEAPRIVVKDKPRGVGTQPVTVTFDLYDEGAGLDEVVVRTRQRNQPGKELLRRALEGRNSARIAIDIAGDRSNLDEGSVDIEIRSFDRSFWSNSASALLTLPVDYRRPRVDILTSQLNVREGGAQLLVYRATDEDISESGIRVSGREFLGFPAKGLDPDLDTPGLYAVFFSMKRGNSSADDREEVFATDLVGNSTVASVAPKFFERPSRDMKVIIDESFLRSVVAKLAEQGLDRLRNAGVLSQKYRWNTGPGSTERLLEQFLFVMNEVRSHDENEIQNLLKSLRFQRLWKEPFLPPGGGAQLAFGDTVTYVFEQQPLEEMKISHYEFAPARSNRSVVAANDGIVIFSQNIGTYGRCVGIDHGLGIASIYGRMDSVRVAAGEAVTRGQIIGEAGTTGFARTPQLLFQVRVQGVPVNPLEWWDGKWLSDHVFAKIIEAKKVLGLQYLIPVT